MTPRLQQALESLYGAERRRDALGLEGTRLLMEALGNPERRFRSVHVAGTNGKGSVATLIERVLRAGPERTGLFTSPHLVEYRERIRVRGRWADDAELEGRLDFLQRLPAAAGRTFFEVTTALAFDHFARAEVDLAVVEVGLGGRLDCTNVVAPEVAVITGVGLDHTEILGTTLAAVAGEKAGIVKPGTPVVTAAREPEASGVIDAAAARAGAPVVRSFERVRVERVRSGPAGVELAAVAAPWGRVEVASGFRGSHQAANLVTALATLSVLAERGTPVSPEALREGFAAARWPGRLEPCPRDPRLWWDGAHNPDGARMLARAWAEDLRFEPPAATVFAAARDKDAAAMLEPLRALAPATRLFVTRTRNERARPAQDLEAAARALGFTAESRADVPAALGAALGAAGERRVLLYGSLFAVGEAMELMGGAPEPVQ